MCSFCSTFDSTCIKTSHQIPWLTSDRGKPLKSSHVQPSFRKKMVMTIANIETATRTQGSSCRSCDISHRLRLERAEISNHKCRHDMPLAYKFLLVGNICYHDHISRLYMSQRPGRRICGRLEKKKHLPDAWGITTNFSGFQHKKFPFQAPECICTQRLGTYGGS